MKGWILKSTQILYRIEYFGIIVKKMVLIYLLTIKIVSEGVDEMSVGCGY
jgi:hypothetical protein